MVLIRHKQTLVERNVPQRAVQYFPEFEVVDPAAPAKPAKRSSKPRKQPPKRRSRKPPAVVESDTTEE